MVQKLKHPQIHQIQLKVYKPLKTRTSSAEVFDKEGQIEILLSPKFRCRNYDIFLQDIYKVPQSTPKSPAATRRLPTPQPHAPRKPPLPPICFRVRRPFYSKPPTSKHANDASSETSVESSSTNGSEIKTSPDSPNSTEGLQATESTRTSSAEDFDKEGPMEFLLSAIFRSRHCDIEDIYIVPKLMCAQLMFLLFSALLYYPICIWWSDLQL
uniref:Uncharacterized protein n=1 Tax=Trichobilharzia regenti TaxID=157069 RepID=A0AA85JQS1_TRIRE|nr:unnamed protein product [Trichobilharzia regenti]